MSDLHNIEAEIAATRAELRLTVDELTERLNPRNQAQEAVEEVKVAVADLRRRVMGDVRPADAPEPTTKGWVVLGAAAGLVLAVVTKVVRKF